MLTKEKIIDIVKERKKIKASEIAEEFDISRQYAHSIIKKLVDTGELVKVGLTKKVFYTIPEYANNHSGILPITIDKTLINKSLEESEVLKELERQFPLIEKLKENTLKIFEYAFTEMLNNAIEHSESKIIKIKIIIGTEILTFSVNDFGVGVFKDIMKREKLNSEIEAIQELLKGKATTKPKSHTGEGIFFTSKIGDTFVLESFGFRLIVNNKINDTFIVKPETIKKGTRVSISIPINSLNRLDEMYKKFTTDYNFNKTEIKVKLFIMGDIFISRSQARRIMNNLEKFEIIILDFDKVETIGQSFADEIFRVFQNKYPNIEIQVININENVKFMIDRAGQNRVKTRNLFEKSNNGKEI